MIENCATNSIRRERVFIHIWVDSERLIYMDLGRKW